MKVFKPPLRAYTISLMLLAIAFLIYLAYPYVQAKGPLPVMMEAPSYELTDMYGKPFASKELDGKVQLVEFFFTSCPDICPITTANMVAMQEPLKSKGILDDKLQFVGITFDPQIDTEEQLQRYAGRMGLDDQLWQILRGEEKYVHDLAASLKIKILKDTDGQFIHPAESLLLIDGKQQLRKVYMMGEEMDVSQIMTDIERLVNET